MIERVRLSASRFNDAVKRAKIVPEFAAVAADPLEAVRAALPLTPDLLAWYETGAPRNLHIPWNGSTLLLYDPLDLPDAQSGYRWEAWEAGAPRNPFAYWDPNWLVIGDIGADPIIAHTEQPDTPISMALHGAGNWTPQPVAPSLATLLDLLTIWLERIIIPHDIGKGGRLFWEAILTSDLEMRPEIVQELKAAWSDVVDESCVKNFLDFVC